LASAVPEILTVKGPFREIGSGRYNAILRSAFRHHSYGWPYGILRDYLRGDRKAVIRRSALDRSLQPSV